MEEAEKYNHTDVSIPDDDVRSYTRSSFPAWIPAVTVAVSMLIFLAGSFYFRHRKVIKKRQILMDYFHIIFQYGGLRRKRMVAALCNTNAITLRELGRSFMRSFDSLGNGDNSCPFFQEDSAFTAASQPMSTPMTQKKSFFRNRGMTITKKYKGPFIRINSHSDENSQPNAVPFHDIMMKFKGKRTHGNLAPVSTPSRRNSHSPQYEGSSMCTIHGDDFDYQKCIEEDETPVTYHRQRRNAYIVPYDSTAQRYADVGSEVGRHSLGHVLPDRFRVQQTSCSGKRNSEPFQNIQGDNSDHIPGQCQEPCLFHVQGDLLSTANVVCGSHGFIPKAYDNSSFQAYRNSEPTILVHSPSTETDATQGWSDIRSRYTNGIVFLKRVPKSDGAPGEFYYEEQRTPSPECAGRANLSKVSYVPSGNMNEYYNCFNSSIKEKKGKEDTFKDKNTAAVNSPETKNCPSRSKRSRLSIGDLAISNFNRRIDLGSDSLHEQDSEQKADKISSQDSSRFMPKSPWTRFKNVLTGSRAAMNMHTQIRTAKSVPSKQDRYKRRNNRRSTSWQRFVSVFTHFRSLPETKKSATSVDIPKVSSSFPYGLNIHFSSCEEAFYLESDTEMRSTDASLPHMSENSTFEEPRTADLSKDESVASDQANDEALRTCGRPTTLHLPQKTQSFPEELINARQYYQRFKTVFDSTRAIQSQANQPCRVGVRRYRKRNDRIVASSLSLPQSKKDFSCYAFQAGYSPSKHEYRFRSCSESTEDKPRAVTPNRLEGIEGYAIQVNRRRFKSLSPLPERYHVTSTQEKYIKHAAELNSSSNRSLYWTPTEAGNMDFHLDLEAGRLLISDEMSHHREVHDCSNIPTYKDSDGQPDSIRLKPTPFELQVHTSLEVSYESAHSLNTCGIMNTDPVFVKQGQDNVETNQNVSNIKTILCSKEEFPKMGHLTLEHRFIGRSNDSVYYDTVSALDTPSPSEHKNILDAEGSPLNFVCDFTGVEDMVHSGDLQSGSGSTNGLLLTTVALRSDSSETQREQTLLQASDFHLNNSPSSNMNKFAQAGVKTACASKSVESKSMPALSVDNLWKQCASFRGFLTTRCFSNPAYFKTRSNNLPYTYRTSDITASHSHWKEQSRQHGYSTPEEICLSRIVNTPTLIKESGGMTQPHCTFQNESPNIGDTSDSPRETITGEVVTASTSAATRNTVPVTSDAVFYVNVPPSI